MSLRHGVLPSVLALLCMLLAVPAVAQEPPPAHSDPYQEALQSLSEGRKNDALKQFQRAIDEEPMHAGAMLEIALIQCSMGNISEAERLFLEIELRFSPPPGIIELITTERRTGCHGRPALSSSSFIFGRGFDQNVNQGATNPYYSNVQGELMLLTDFLPKSDQYSLLGADYMREITPNGSIGFAQFQSRRNDTLRQYDSNSLYLGVESPYRLGRWTARSTAMLGLTTLGGSLYQRQAQLQARIVPPLPLPDSLQFTLMGGITHIQHVTLANFDANTFELRGQLSYRKDDLYGNASLAYVQDRAVSDRPGGDRRGMALNLLGRRLLWASCIGEMAYVYQKWDSELPYAPGMINEVRHQATHVMRGTLIYPLGKNQALQLEARFVRNNKDISLFQYNNRQLQLSYQWQSP